MTGERLTWQLKTDMKIVILRAAPGGASAASPIESTVPSAGETIVSSPPSGVRSGSRKNWIRKSVTAARNAAQTERPSQAVSPAAAAGGRMKTYPALAIGILSARPPCGGCARSPPCGP